MLEVTGIRNGIVIDHIPAGKGIKVFTRLFSNYAESSVVLLMNVDSDVLGKKDIIKIEDEFDFDLEVLGLIDNNVTVNIIKDYKLIEKMTAKLPTHIHGFIECENPRCITKYDIWAEPDFTLVDKKDLSYACSYCEEITKYKF